MPAIPAPLVRQPFQTMEMAGSERSRSGPSIREAKGTYRLRPVRNLPLGVLEPMAYQQFTVKLSEQDLVLVYTDGLTEARNRSDELLGEDAF